MRSIIIIVSAWLCLGGTAFADDEKPVQSVLLRAVTVTHNLEESVHFYRDILGQEVVVWSELDAKRSARWLDIGPNAKVFFVVLKGSGEYPGGPTVGGRIAFIGIDDPDASKGARGDGRLDGGKGQDGSMIFPHRVANLDKIFSQIKAEGYGVLYPPGVSGTGLSRSTMVIDPNGKIVELFELFPGRPPEE